MLHIPLFHMNTCASHIQFFVTQRFVHKIDKQWSPTFQWQTQTCVSFLSTLIHIILANMLYMFDLIWLKHFYNKPC